MEVTLKGSPKEIAALVLALQERQDTDEEIRRKYILTCINGNFDSDELFEFTLDRSDQICKERVEPVVVEQEPG